MEDYNVYCNQVLVKNFPDLLETPLYKETVSYYGNQSAGFLYETAFLPYVLDLIKKDNTANKKKIDKAFNLIEEMLGHENFHVRCVAEVEFIEPFVATLEPTKDVEKYLRPKSLAAARDLARKWFKINPETWEATE